MHFSLVDTVLEETDDSITTLKQVSAAEEYLQDHFADFPVLPGVLMLEAMVQAARRLAEARPGTPRLVLGAVRGLKYGSFVRPGTGLRVHVTLDKAEPDGSISFKGQGTVNRPGLPHAGDDAVAVSGRFTLRPLVGVRMKP